MSAPKKARIENVSPFTKVVVNAMRKLYPEKLADSNFDNTGLLLEAPYRPEHLKNEVLLTIDLTKGVVNEAIKRKSSIIVSYHPIIFRPLKSLTQSNSQQESLLRLAQEGISVYSPHTAVDAAPGGLNDYLCDIITGQIHETDISHSHKREVITSVHGAPSGYEGAGYGRIVRFQDTLTLGEIVRNITQHLKLGRGLSVAVPQHLEEDDKWGKVIESVGVCAGSGGSLLNNADVDVLFTGELSHHEALAAIEKGKCVITTYHSNSERAYLSSRMRQQLWNEIDDGIQALVKKDDWPEECKGEHHVEVSQVDKDPYEIVSLGRGDWAGGLAKAEARRDNTSIEVTRNTREKKPPNASS